MKKILVFIFFLFCCIAYSEEIGDASPSYSLENEYFLSPTLGWGPVGAVASLDFMYRKYNGFAMFVNFNLAVPFAPKGGIVTFSELYFGYSLKKGNFYATFAGGLWAGGGLGFYRYKTERDKKYEIERPLAFGNDSPTTLYVLTMFALRNDYTYFFNEKIGINASHTHGFGLSACRWILDDNNLYVYNFLLKFGVTFKI